MKIRSANFVDRMVAAILREARRVAARKAKARPGPRKLPTTPARFADLSPGLRELVLRTAAREAESELRRMLDELAEMHRGGEHA
jgi:hypothetical protein